MTEGWKKLKNRIKCIQKAIWQKDNTLDSINIIDLPSMKKSQAKPHYYEYENADRNAMTKFVNDIFRDIECDVVYFVMLRHIFGTKNISEELPEINL
jgi:hypothetical protein